MFRPINYQPLAKTLDVTAPASSVGLGGFAWRKWFAGKEGKYPQKLFPLPFRACRKDLKHCFVNGVFVRQLHRPTARRRSCKASSSTSPWPLPWRQASSRRPISACHAGSSARELWRMYSANSNRSSTGSSSTARLSSTMPISQLCFDRRYFQAKHCGSHLRRGCGTRFIIHNS